MYLEIMYIVLCRLYNVHCTMYTIQCILNNIQCIVYTKTSHVAVCVSCNNVYYNMLNVHCTMYSWAMGLGRSGHMGTE